MLSTIAVVLGIIFGLVAHWIFGELRKVESAATKALDRPDGLTKYRSITAANLEFWKRVRVLVPLCSILGLLLMWGGLVSARPTGLLAIVGFAVVGLMTALVAFDCIAVVNRMIDKGTGSWNEIESWHARRREESEKLRMARLQAETARNEEPHLGGAERHFSSDKDSVAAEQYFWQAMQAFGSGQLKDAIRGLE